MRSLRSSLAAGLVFAAGATATPGAATAQNAPTARDLLALQPVVKGVEYETPADAASIDACKIETVFDARKKAIGVMLRDGQGRLLRRFVDADGDKGRQMDQWSYYQDGFEVYRETDLNGDLRADECRWLNTAGTRVANVALAKPREYKVTGWKRISAEEASKVFVQGLVSGDLALIQSVFATPEELAALGIPKGEVDRVAAASAKRYEQVQALLGGLKKMGWNNATVWNRLDGLMPHLIPADAASGLSQDLVLYENAVIFVGNAGGQASPDKVAFLQAPEMVRIGETWKFVEMPRAVDPGKPVMAAEGGLRNWIFRQQTGPAAESPEAEAALKALADYDNANAKVQAEGGKTEVAQFHVGRIPLLRAVVKATPTADEQLNYNKQIVDSLAAAYQTGVYANGLKLLDGLIAEGGKVASYAAFRKVSAEFAAGNDEPGANLMANQKKWMTDLRAFLDAYPKSEEAPDALLQLASASEFNAEEDDARKSYERLARDFPTTDAGKKAAGAIKRLDLVGKPIDLRGPGLNGQSVDLSRFKGKTLLVNFWASWADPVRRDLPELVKVYQKYKGKDFEIVGVNLDNEKADVETFLKENPLPWTQLFEPGGIEKSRFATEYGIIALPTMILVDPQGKVLNRNLRSAAELDRQLDKTLASSKGVALDHP